MKALTVRQPSASLLALGIKTTETRSWAPPTHMHGQRMAIHAARSKVARKDLRLLSKFKHRDMPRVFQVPYGAVVATARLVTAFRVGTHTPDGMFALCDSSHTDYCPGNWHVIDIDSLGDFSLGKWVWVFDRIERLDPPMEANGHQNLWEWASETSVSS